MKINTSELQTLILVVAKGRFGDRAFRRRELMNLAEGVARTLDLWCEEDDNDSQSAGSKSAGLAAIDWAISNLKDNGLTHAGHDQWHVA